MAEPIAGMPANVTVVRSPFFREVYAANLRLRVNVLDATIAFMNSVDQVGGAQALQEEVNVTMPFAAVKILSEHLAMVVATIEKELGPIRIPVTNRPTDQQKASLIQALNATPLSE